MSSNNTCQQELQSGKGHSKVYKISRFVDHRIGVEDLGTFRHDLDMLYMFVFFLKMADIDINW